MFLKASYTKKYWLKIYQSFEVLSPPGRPTKILKKNSYSIKNKNVYH